MVMIVESHFKVQAHKLTQVTMRVRVFRSKHYQNIQYNVKNHEGILTTTTWAQNPSRIHHTTHILRYIQSVKYTPTNRWSTPK